MSYARWSSDNFQSDVYVYEDVSGGWTTHVAGNRIVGRENIAPMPDLPEHGASEKEFQAFAEGYKRHLDSVGKAERDVIGLPYDGRTFNDATPGRCAARLIKLKNAGYYVPQYAIDDLLEEQEEMDAEAV